MLVGCISGCLPRVRSVVLTEFNRPTVLPRERDTLMSDDDQLSRNKAGISKLLLRYLTLASEAFQVRSKGDFPRRDMVIAGDFDGFNVISRLGDFNHLIEVSTIVADPFA